MTTVVRKHAIFIKTPLHEIFDYVSDLTRHPEWSGGELKVEAVSPGSISVGKEYFSLGEVAVQKHRPNKLHVTQYDSPHAFGFAAQDPDFGQVTHVFTFEEQKGGVLVTRTMTVNLNPLVALGFRFLVYPLIGSPSMDKAMSRLKAKLEAPS